MKYFCLMLLGSVLLSINSKSQTVDIFTKERSLHLSKKYIIENILGTNNESVVFDVDALTISSSQEVVCLAYNCITKNMQGLVFTFWGNYWNNNGVIYTGYGFKSLNRDSASILLDRLKKEIDLMQQYKIALPDTDANSYFTFSDMTFLITPNLQGSTSIRIFWKTFDADWGVGAIDRTKRRLDKWFKNQ
jgi:hypothetical protein